MGLSIDPDSVRHLTAFLPDEPTPAEAVQAHNLDALKRLAVDWRYSDEMVGVAFRRWVRDEAS